VTTLATSIARFVAAPRPTDRARVSRLVRRTGKQERVPAAAFDLLERFVERLPGGSLDDVLASFAMIEQRIAA
jgi:hypothetical protein